MPAHTWRQEVAGQRQIVGIVQDEEPAGVTLEPVLYRGDDMGALLLALFRQVEQCGDGEIGRVEVLTSIGLCPQDGLIVSSIPIGIFQGQLCFANASQATDGLWLGECGGLACVESARQLGEQLLTTCKEWVLWVRDIPDRR